MLSGLSIPSDFLGGIRSCLRVFGRLTARLEAFFFGDLACPSVPFDDRGPEIFGGTDSLRPEKFPFCLLSFTSHEGESLDRLFTLSLTGF